MFLYLRSLAGVFERIGEKGAGKERGLCTAGLSTQHWHYDQGLEDESSVREGGGVGRRSDRSAKAGLKAWMPNAVTALKHR